jgi:hypothetical protein
VLEIRPDRHGDTSAPDDAAEDRDAAARVSVWSGPEVEPRGAVPAPDAALRRWPTWAPLAAAVRGIPSPRGAEDGIVGDLAAATAGFRDQFYGLVPHVREGADDAGRDLTGFPRLVTTGVVRAGRCDWGRRPTRFAGTRWSAPVVDPAGLEAAPPLARGVRGRLRPQLLVATQAPTIEAPPDPLGRLVPSVPVVSLEPHDPADLWRLLAVLLSPLASARALERYGGAGLGRDSVKLAARQVLALPLPARRAPWDEAAERCRSAWSASEEGDLRGGLGQLEAGARWMGGADGLEPGDAAGLHRWWRARLRLGEPG